MAAMAAASRLGSRQRVMAAHTAESRADTCEVQVRSMRSRLGTATLGAAPGPIAAPPLSAARRAISARLVVAAPGAIAAMVGVSLASRSWGSSLIAGADSTAIIGRTDRSIHDLVERGHLNGWAPYFGIGHDAFLINPPGFTLAVGLVRAVSFGQLSTAGAINVLMTITFMVLPWSVACFARSLRLANRVAWIAGTLALAISLFAGFGLRGVFDTGLFPFQLAAPLFFSPLLPSSIWCSSRQRGA